MLRSTIISWLGYNVHRAAAAPGKLSSAVLAVCHACLYLYGSCRVQGASCPRLFSLNCFERMHVCTLREGVSGCCTRDAASSSLSTCLVWCRRRYPACEPETSRSGSSQASDPSSGAAGCSTRCRRWRQSPSKRPCSRPPGVRRFVAVAACEKQRHRTPRQACPVFFIFSWRSTPTTLLQEHVRLWSCHFFCPCCSRMREKLDDSVPVSSRSSPSHGLLACCGGSGIPLPTTQRPRVESRRSSLAASVFRSRLCRYSSAAVVCTKENQPSYLWQGALSTPSIITDTRFCVRSTVTRTPAKF